MRLKRAVFPCLACSGTPISPVKPGVSSVNESFSKPLEFSENSQRILFE
jgi:hypothetical protein